MDSAERFPSPVRWSGAGLARPDLSDGERRAVLLAPDEELLAPPPPRRVSPVLPPPPERGAPGLPQRLVLLACKCTIVFLLAWGIVFNFSEVRGSSMEPGIHDRDRILVDNLSYLVTDVERGDVVILRYPLDPSIDYIKRVIGLPGDEIAIARGKVWVNGDELVEPYVAASAIEPWTTMTVRVREGQYFVLGDNRRRSSDSREFGQVPFEYLRGKVRLRLWPLERVGLVH